MVILRVSSKGMALGYGFIGGEGMGLLGGGGYRSLMIFAADSPAIY